MIKKLIFWHLRPGYLADQITPSRRAVYRFFRDTDTYGPAVILLSLADWRATRGPLTNARKRARHEKIMLALLDEYFQEKNKKPLKKIINGHALMKKLRIKSSPLIGMLLKKIAEEQALGTIRTRQQAYAMAATLLRARAVGTKEKAV